MAIQIYKSYYLYNMKTLPYLFGIGLLAATSMISCKKQGTKSNFRLENYYSNTTVHADVYSNESDYLNGTNPIVKATVDANTTYEFSSSILKDGSWYYVDVYNDDYTITNWANSDNIIIGQDSASSKRFKYNSDNDVFVLSTIQTNARNVLLKATATSSKWRAIGAIDLEDGSDIWWSLSAAERYQELYFYKTSTGIHKYLQGTDTALRNFSFKETTITGYPTFIINAYPSNLHLSITNTYKNIVVSPDDQPPTKDSLLALLNGNLYILKRQ